MGSSFLPLLLTLCLSPLLFGVVQSQTNSYPTYDATEFELLVTEVAQLQSQVAQLDSDVDPVSTVTVTNYGSDPIVSVGVNLNNYLYGSAYIYQNIQDALARKVISKIGNPNGWDSTSYATSQWNHFNAINIGNGVQTDGNGIVVTIPNGYNVLWIRVFNDRWATFRVSPYSTATSWTPAYEFYAAGYRGLLELSPDGTLQDAYAYEHIWVPIPIRGSSTGRKYIVLSDQQSSDWISGIAFGTNIWSHAKNSAVAYYWVLNGGSGVTWNSANWNSDVLGQLPNGVIVTLVVPIVPNGKDKLLYIVEHNDNWSGVAHGPVTVNGSPVERFRDSYINPFAQHFNSKFYSRYIATRIPASLYQPGDLFVTVTIDFTKTDNVLYFREAGTHDYF